MTTLSSYRLMWVMTLFDLPVGTRKERKAAADFRHFLLDQGFQMAQFSVYMRFCAGKPQADTYCKRIKDALPDGGKVDILVITDKQYEKIISFTGRTRQHRKNPDQFTLF